MGLSKTDGGQFALLGGRRCLALVNLAKDPHSVVKRSSRGFKWDVTAIRWDWILKGPTKPWILEPKGFLRLYNSPQCLIKLSIPNYILITALIRLWTLVLHLRFHGLVAKVVSCGAWGLEFLSCPFIMFFLYRFIKVRMSWTVAWSNPQSARK